MKNSVPERTCLSCSWLRGKASVLLHEVYLSLWVFLGCTFSGWKFFILFLVCWVFYQEIVLCFIKYFCIYWDDHVFSPPNTHILTTINYDSATSQLLPGSNYYHLHVVYDNIPLNELPSVLLLHYYVFLKLHPMFF